MPVQPGAEPFAAEGYGELARVGVVLCHGMSGNPWSVRPWGEHLAAAGLTVLGPRLPGHGTSWREANRTRWTDWYAELERAFRDLRGRCDAVVACGLSMGGTLVLRLAEEHGDDVAGVVTVNPSLSTDRKDAPLLPLLSRLVPALPGIGDDIAKPGTSERAYRVLPLRAVASLAELWPLVRADLPRITAPVLTFRSRVDHVVEPTSGRQLLEGMGGGSVEERVLEHSHHVATLDHDAPLIFEESLDFIRRVTAQGGRMTGQVPA